MLHIAQGNALGGAYALIKVSRPVRATCFMRGNAPWHRWCVCYALGARGIFVPLAQKCRMFCLLQQRTQGVALGYGQHLGFQPASTVCPFGAYGGRFAKRPYRLRISKREYLRSPEIYGLSYLGKPFIHKCSTESLLSVIPKISNCSGQYLSRKVMGTPMAPS